MSFSFGEREMVFRDVTFIATWEYFDKYDEFRVTARIPGREYNIVILVSGVAMRDVGLRSLLEGRHVSEQLFEESMSEKDAVFE